jgi:F-type H+-transporting ATPase subunit epsilon
MLNLEIITPERIMVQEEVDLVEGKGALGEFGILPGHIQFLTILDIGEVRYSKNGKTTSLATSGGFGEVVDDRVTFLLDTGEFAVEIDPERAQAAVEAAQESLKEFPVDSVEYKKAEQAYLRATTRLQVASKKQ